MIFVTIGSMFPFDRMIRAMDAWAGGAGQGEEVLAQIGDGAFEPRHMTWVRRLDRPDYAAAVALALAGDLTQSRALAEELAREFPEDTSVQSLYLPALRALFSLNTPTPDAAAAIQALQTASRYDLALGRVGFIGRFGGLYPIYVRGLAYLAARQPAEAAAEFQRIVDHRSIVLVDPVDAMARLQLARALALAGDTVRAKSVYNDLLTLWRNADPDIPVLNDTRAEYARLR